MKLSSRRPVVVRACFLPDESLTESVRFFVDCDCPSSLFPNRRYSPVVEIRLISISSAPLANFRTMSNTRCPLSVSGICFWRLCDMARKLRRLVCSYLDGEAPWPVPMTCCGCPFPQFGVPQRVQLFLLQTASQAFQNSGVIPE